GSIADGETKEFTTPEGQHKIEAKIDWCGSPELSFNIKDTEIKHLTVSGYKNSTLIISAALILSVIHFVLFFGFNINYTALLFAPLLLMMLYYVTLGRKKYLSLNENNSEIDKHKYKIYTWKNWTYLHYIINPGVAFGE